MPLALVLAPLDVACAVAKSALEPTLRKIEEETGSSIRVKLHQWTPSGTLDLGELSISSGSESHVEALGRLSFRPNHGGDLFLFRAELLLPAETYPGTGFTGFLVDGSVRHGACPPSVKIRGECMTYNHGEFSRL